MDMPSAQGWIFEFYLLLLLITSLGTLRTPREHYRASNHITNSVYRYGVRTGMSNWFVMDN